MIFDLFELAGREHVRSPSRDGWNSFSKASTHFRSAARTVRVSSVFRYHMICSTYSYIPIVNTFAEAIAAFQLARIFGTCRRDMGQSRHLPNLQIQALAHPRLGTRPMPSLSVINWLTGSCSKDSTNPLGQCTSMSIAV